MNPGERRRARAAAANPGGSSPSSPPTFARRIILALQLWWLSRVFPSCRQPVRPRPDFPDSRVVMGGSVEGLPLPPAAATPPHAVPRRSWSGAWLTLLGFGFLTFNSGLDVYRAQGDRAAIAFVAFSYLDLVALFACLSMYEIAEAGSALRHRLKVAVWLLTTAFTAVFSYKAAAVMPAAVAFVVWLMAFAAVAGGFYGFFCSTETTLQPLLPQLQPGPSLAAGCQGGGLSWLITLLVFCFLTLICGMAIYGSQGNGGAVAFVVFAYFDLLLLFYGMRPHDQAGDPHALRRRAVWATTWTLTLLLCGMFAWGVAAVMPLPMAAVVYAMTATALVGVYAMTATTVQ